MQFLEPRKLGPAYTLMRECVSTANTDGWVKWGQPVTHKFLAAQCGVSKRTIRRWIGRLSVGGYIEAENYGGRGSRLRIAEEFRTRAHQMPLFNGPQTVRKTSGKVQNIQ